MGKPGSEILDGNVEWLGSFEQCKAATEAKGSNVSFNTQYCLAPMVSQDNFEKKDTTYFIYYGSRLLKSKFDWLPCVVTDICQWKSLAVINQ